MPKTHRVLSRAQGLLVEEMGWGGCWFLQEGWTPYLTPHISIILVIRNFVIRKNTAFSSTYIFFGQFSKMIFFCVIQKMRNHSFFKNKDDGEVETPHTTWTLSAGNAGRNGLSLPAAWDDKTWSTPSIRIIRQKPWKSRSKGHVWMRLSCSLIITFEHTTLFLDC